MLRHLETDNRFSASSQISYGFTKGRTLADAQLKALALRKERPWVLQADIIKFFDRIDRKAIKKLIVKSVRSKLVSHLLCEAVDCELDDGDGGGSEIVILNGIQKGRGLRQGMPVSPMLSNLLLKAFDNVLQSKGISAIRYADDMAIFGSNRDDCLRALELVQTTLSHLNLAIPRT